MAWCQANCMAANFFQLVDGAPMHLTFDDLLILFPSAVVLSSVVLPGMDESSWSSVEIVAEHPASSDREFMRACDCLTSLLWPRLSALKIDVSSTVLDTSMVDGSAVKSLRLHVRSLRSRARQRHGEGEGPKRQVQVLSKRSEEEKCTSYPRHQRLQLNSIKLWDHPYDPLKIAAEYWNDRIVHFGKTRIHRVLHYLSERNMNESGASSSSDGHRI